MNKGFQSGVGRLNGLVDVACPLVKGDESEFEFVGNISEFAFGVRDDHSEVLTLPK